MASTGFSTLEFNPKIHDQQKKKRKKKFNFDFAAVKNPITLQVKDPVDIRTAFEKRPLIPYAGDGKETCNGLLHFLESCRFMSPTLGACHEAIKTFAFGSKLDIDYIQDEDFDLDDAIKTVSLPIKQKYRDFIRENVSLNVSSYTQLTENLYDSLKGGGNYWIELVHTITAGKKHSAIHYHPSQCCCYWATSKNNPDLIALSPRWDDEYLKENPLRLVEQYPRYSVSDKGTTYRTVIHVKNGNFKYYGRPDWIASWMNVYGEFQDHDYKLKIASNQFTGQVFMELEDDDIENDDPWDNDDAIEEGFDGIIDKIENNFSAKSDDPQTIMVSTRPYGSKHAFIYQFKPNTSHDYYKVNSELDRQKIIENNQWSEKLLGNSTASGWQTNTYIDELRVKEASVVNYYRCKVSFGTNLCMQEIMKWHNQEDLKLLGITPKSMFNVLRESYLKDSLPTDEFQVNENTNNSVGGS